MKVLAEILAALFSPLGDLITTTICGIGQNTSGQNTSGRITSGQNTNTPNLSGYESNYLKYKKKYLDMKRQN